MLKVPKFSDVIDKQRNFFGTGKTKDISFRIEQLKLLKKTIVDNKEAILKALQSDLNKPEFEAYGLEIAFCLEEINNAQKNINNWTKPKKIKAPITQFLSTAKIYSEPLGVVLIIGPWNYPFQLVIAPLVAAIASGNCAILKPSEISANTSYLLAEIILKYFNPEFVAVVEGGVDTSQQLLEEKFDHIFFTGSGEIGRIVMAAAAKHLTPVTLELGGKTPCIVDAKTHLEYTARRIVWGKFMNAGQTCVAPDYLLVDRKIKEDLLEQIKKCISEFYGENPEKSPDYARIINQKHFNRLCKFLDNGEIVIGGDTNPSERYMAPTLIEGVGWQDAVMQEEIFGPILPVIEYTELTEAIALVNAKPKPLALYFFSTDKQKQQRVLHQTSSGGACINDTVMHLAVLDLPFGGVGESGIGRYHGKAGFDTFSHQKSVLNKSFLVDVKLRYAPYLGKLKLLKSLIK